jgi:4-cresol dehydrogenase (hydroxylating)
MSDAAFEAACEAWSEAIGEACVVRTPADLASASTATFATTARVLARLRPSTRAEVQACVRIANGTGIPLYPISTGKNWGYGSSVPVRDAVLLDLGALNRIVDFDEELAYVTIEPGVTQRQLAAFLRDRGARLWMDATGASPDCSIIGNTMERGFGHTPMGDHCGNACAFEVVLPTGDCVQTGFARFPRARAGALGRWGVGPSLDGLFSQSNLGIVTRMTVWLMPAPEKFQAFFFMVRDEDGLAGILDALRPLRLNGTLRSVMHVGNDYKVVTGTMQFPWDAVTGPRPVLDQAHIRRLRNRLGIGAWNGSGGLYGSPGQVREARRQLKRALRGRVDRLQFVDDRTIGLLRRFAAPFKMVTGWDVPRTLAVLEPVYGLMRGVPTDGTMGSAYWRKRTPPPSDPDPDRDGCGLLWCSPTFPNTGEDGRRVTGIGTRVLLAHGFEPQMSISLATERACICVITISYDRNAEGEDERARACYDALAAELLEAGYPSYRLTVASMATVADPTGAPILRTLKQAIDPNGMLAPGRYEPVDPLS